MSSRSGSLRALGGLGLVALALGGFALGAVPPPSITSISSPGNGRTLTVTGKNFTHLRAVRFRGRRIQFTVVSPTEITATVPTARRTEGTRLSFVFAKITLTLKDVCPGCKDEWAPSG